MPPFTDGKAIRSRGAFDPDGREMRRHEREFEAAMSRALNRLRRDVERDIGDDPQVMIARLNDPAITRPFQDAVTRELERVALAGADYGRITIEREVFGVKALDVAMWELANNAAAQWAIQFGQTLAGMMLMTTTERIQLEIAEYILNSQTIGDLIARIRWGNVYSEDRARQIAVTEVTRAFAEGNMASWRASGVIEKKVVKVNNDELVCPICSAKNEKVFDLDDPEGNPPFHPRCRCWITPVVE